MNRRIEGFMVTNTRVKFIAIVLLTIVAVSIVAPFPGKSGIPLLSEARIHPGIDLAGGAELRYKVLFEPGFNGDRQQATRAATDVIRRRLEARQLQTPKITTLGDNQVVIQLPGVDADGLRECKRLIETFGNLELHAAAQRDLQEGYDQDGVVPEGYMVVDNTDGARLLIQTKPVIEGRHVVHSEPQQEMQPGGVRWLTSFELDAEGARIFDEAAGKLYRQRPPGRIVILFDGRVKSAPVVQSPSFHGRGQISGAKDQNEARELSIILRSGSLPAPLGSTTEGSRSK
jgi:protein-export membrane protein SecD